MNSVTAGAFPDQQPVDRTAFGLSIQKDQLNVHATGNNGVARRTVPQASAQFSQPPLSGGQFGDGHAKSQATINGQPILGG